MKLATTVLLFAIAGLASAQESGTAAREPRVRELPAPARALTAPGLGTPWLGVSWKDLDDATRAQVPDLPQGIGFVVRVVDPGSPCETAGIKSNDLVWRLGDQWIANRDQFLTLLRLHKEGDEVKLGIYRSGKAMEILVTLGHLPEAPVALGDPKDKDGHDLPMKVVVPDKSARLETPEGKATLSRNGGVFEVKIVSTSGSVVYEGLLRDENGTSLVPDSWQLCVGALERGFSHEPAVSAPSRPPRLRTIAPPAEDAAK